MLTWSEELNIPGVLGLFWETAESPKWDRIHMDFMESRWDHSVPYAKGWSKKPCPIFYVPFRSKVIDRFVGATHNFEHFQS